VLGAPSVYHGSASSLVDGFATQGHLGAVQQT
jgi:hypothetical protein